VKVGLEVRQIMCVPEFLLKSTAMLASRKQWPSTSPAAVSTSWEAPSTKHRQRSR
jgi:hypothetical protein